MKTFKIIKQTMCVCLLVLASVILKSDIIPSNSREAERKVVITNCKDFPEIHLFGYITGVMLPENPIYPIWDNLELHSGYHLNKLNIAAIESEQLTKIGGIDSLTTDYIESKITSQEIMSSGIYFVDENSILILDEIFYKIIKDSNSKYIAHLSQRILTFSDDSKEVINY